MLKEIETSIWSIGIQIHIEQTPIVLCMEARSVSIYVPAPIGHYYGWFCYASTPGSMVKAFMDNACFLIQIMKCAIIVNKNVK